MKADNLTPFQWHTIHGKVHAAWKSASYPFKKEKSSELAKHLDGLQMNLNTTLGM
jgi:hypothetical protein